MDVLGVLAGVQPHRWTLHWQLGQLWHDAGTGCAIAGKRAVAGDYLLLIPDVVLRLHSANCHWRFVRARQDRAIAGVWLPVGDHRLLP